MSDVRWRAASPETLRAVTLDDLTVLYHRPSGTTHLVDAPVPEILAALADEPLTIEALLARLAVEHELVDPDRGALSARLEELAAAGVVTPT